MKENKRWSKICERGRKWFSGLKEMEKNCQYWHLGIAGLKLYRKAMYAKQSMQYKWQGEHPPSCFTLIALQLLYYYHVQQLVQSGWWRELPHSGRKTARRLRLCFYVVHWLSENYCISREVKQLWEEGRGRTNNWKVLELFCLGINENKTLHLINPGRAKQIHCHQLSFIRRFQEPVLNDYHQIKFVPEEPADV